MPNDRHPARVPAIVAVALCAAILALAAAIAFSATVRSQEFHDLMVSLALPAVGIVFVVVLARVSAIGMRL